MEGRPTDEMKGDTRKLILRTLTEPSFRRLLGEDPKKALGVPELTESDEAQIRLVLAAVRGIDGQIAALADELLCATGGCGIVTA